MDINEAARLVRNVKYRPDWTFTPDMWQSNENALVVSVRMHVRNSDPQYAPSYQHYDMVSAQLIIPIYGIWNEIQFYRVFWEQIYRVIEQHESREFFKVEISPGVLVSPFHPHTYDGMMRHNGSDVPLDDAPRYEMRDALIGS